jgi:hypothetical protein
MAGSVGESAAPISRPDDKGKPNSKAATEPVTSAVSTTPGTTSSRSPMATFLRIPTESWRPP